MATPTPQEWLATQTPATPTPQEWLATQTPATPTPQEWLATQKAEVVKESNPVVDYGKAVLGNVSNLYAGAAKGAVRPLAMIGGRIAPETTEKAAQYANTKLIEAGFNPESTAYKVGDIAGETAITAPVGGVLAKGAQALKASPAIVNALRTSGVESGAGSLGAKLGRSVLTGGLTGGVTAVITNPDLKNIGLGTAVGAVAPTALGLLGSAASKGYDLYKGATPKVRAGNITRQLLGETLEDTRLKLADSTEDLTAAQAAFGTAAPEFAAAGEFGAKTSGVPYLVKQLRQEAGRVGALDEATPNLESAVITENQIAAARTAELLRQHDVSLANQAADRTAFERTIANPSPTTTGETITSRKAILERSARDAVKPLYTEAYAAAPEPFSLKPVEDIAKGIKGNIATMIDPNVAPDVVDKAQKLFGTSTTAGTPASFNVITGFKAAETGTLKAAEGTLADVHELRSAVNSAIAAIKGDPNLAKTDRNLKLLKSGIDDAIKQGVPEDAFNKYKQANSTFKSTVVEPYLKGEVSKLTRLNSVGTPILASNKVAAKFLSSPTEAQQFTSAFKNDPEAIKNLQQGIEGIFYNDVVKGTKSADKFLSDNSHALAELDTLGIGLRNRLADIGNGLSQVKASESLLSEAGKAIPKRVAEEAANASSAANQSRIIKGLRDKLVPYAGKENAAGFLTALNDPNLTKLNVAEQLGGLQSVESELLRDAALAREAEAGRGAFADAWKKNTFREKLPSYLDPKVATANKAIGIVENAVATATGKVISAGMESPEAALKMLAMYPADQRIAILKALRQSGPTVARAAVASSTQ
jgi:hypothetical protein